MNKIGYFVLMAAVSVVFTACGGAANNAPANNANSNANAAKPVAAAPTVDALLALDKQANEAYFKGDGKFFEGFLSDKFVMYDMGQRMDKAGLTKMAASSKCNVKEGGKLEDPQIAKIDSDTYVISYKAAFDGTCTGPDGKSMKVPSPVRAASVYVRNGDKWQGAFHGENPIIDPKAAAPAPPPAGEKKEQPKKEEVKKEEGKKEEPKKDSKAAANGNAAAPAAPTKPVADANTAALVAIHTSGFEAFKAKDSGKFAEITTTDVSTVDPMGRWASSQAAVIKLWTETTKCEGITKVAVTDGFASALSPTVEILTSKGTANGTCDGQKNGSLWGSAFYVKEGDAWKLAFLFESPGM